MTQRTRLTQIRGNAYLKFADGSRKDFLQEHGDDLVNNPNPDGKDKIKIKSLPSGDEKAKGFFQKMLDSWRGEDDGKGDEEKGQAAMRKTLTKLKPSSEKDMLSFYQNVTRDSATVKNKTDLQNFVKKHFEDAVEAWVKNPPTAANAPKKPSLKDLGMHYNDRALITDKKIDRIAKVRQRLTQGSRKFGKV